jgi:hypothetical protein
VADSLIGPERLAAEIDVALSAFVAFQAGDAELPFGAFERLARRMGLAFVKQVRS